MKEKQKGSSTNFTRDRTSVPALDGRYRGYQVRRIFLGIKPLFLRLMADVLATAPLGQCWCTEVVPGVYVFPVTVVGSIFEIVMGYGSTF